MHSHLAITDWRLINRSLDKINIKSLEYKHFNIGAEEKHIKKLLFPLSQVILKRVERHRLEKNVWPP